jgi:Flp pilus assembly protein CpaB
LEVAERLFLTRRGTLLVALGAAVLAGIILLVYVKSVRNNANSNATGTPVLVARSLIQKGTPGTTVGTEHLYQIETVPKSAVLAGAYVDPSSLSSGVAAADIYPGQQLTAADFGAATSSLDSQISGAQRAFSFPMTAANTLDGQIVAGDHVDVFYASGGTVRQLLQKVLVLNATASEATVRVTSQQAALLALAVGSGTIWMTLRPPVGAPLQSPVTAVPSQLAGHS